MPLLDRSELAFAAGTAVVEYRLRWRGFARNYDTWRTAHYLSDVFELVTAYRQAQRNKGVIFTDTVPPLPTESRDVSVQPPVDPDAVLRPHFRATSVRATLPLALAARSKPAAIAATPAGASQPPVPVVRPLPAAGEVSDEPFYAGLADIYPAESKVLVKHGDSGWWGGVVRRSFSSRTRQSSTPPARRIVVEFDDPRYAGELFEHGLRGTPVQLLLPGETPSTVGASLSEPSRRAHTTPMLTALSTIAEELDTTNLTSGGSSSRTPVTSDRDARRQRRVNTIASANPRTY